MQITQLITLIAMVLSGGFVDVVIVQAIKQVAWPSFVKFILSVVVAGIVALAGLWTTGDVQAVAALWGHLTATDVWQFAVLVFSAAAAWYNLYFKGSGWSESLAAFPKGKS